VCGICGVVQIAGAPREIIEPRTLDAMTDTMTHRGPNDRGTWSGPGFAMGVRRLSIVDVEGGHQPFANETGDVVAAQNGELYEHDRLRQELRASGHSFRSRCDTEILPHLYERDGVEFVSRLRGKFGLAVWDSRERRAVIARDRLGVKPLYYAMAGDLLVFGSELKSVLASGVVPIDLDLEAIDAYLTLGFVPGPRTPLAAVSKLPAGHRLVVHGGRVSVDAYWEYPAPRPEQRPVVEWAQLLVDELEDAVRLRLMSDVPLGVMLSGGLDSSLIAALMARNSTEPVRTFAVGFGGAGPANELADARRMASLLGARHEELELVGSDLDIDLSSLVWHMDEPLADLSALGFLALSELASRSVSVALSGQGADELLAGYSRHRAMATAARLHAVPGGMRAAKIAARCGPRRVRRGSSIVAETDPAARYLALKGNLDAATRRALFGDAMRHSNGSWARRAAVEASAGGSGGPLDQLLRLDARLGMVEDMLHYFDRASMAHSLEVRVPFLDHHLVELCARIPADLKVRSGTTKFVLRAAARGLVPDTIIDKPKIGFFNAAVGNWLRRQAAPAVSAALLDPGARYTDLLQRPAVERLVAEQRRGDDRHADLLLSVLMLELWLSSYLPRSLRSPVVGAAT
jgi:asparagine synthase (glutamine-hydrolysing)